MATNLAPLSNLESLSLGFSSPRSHPSQPVPSPLARVTLFALTHFSFRGVSEYSEDLVSRIDTPALDRVDVHFFMDLDFHIPQLNQLIARVERFKLTDRAGLFFGKTDIGIYITGQATFSLTIHCDRLDYQVSSMTQVCHELSPYLSFVEKLDVMLSAFLGTLTALGNDMDSAQWLELFHPFIAVQSLWVAEDLVPLVAPALQELAGDRASEVLPALCDLGLEGLEPLGPLSEAIQPFVTARQLSDHPVAMEFGDLTIQPSSQILTTNLEDESIGEVSEDDDDARSEDGSSSERGRGLRRTRRR